MDTLAITAIVLLVAGCLFGWTLDDRVLTRLRFSHPDIWQALGPPSKVFDDMGMAYFHAVEEFCRRPEYRSQCDPDFVRLAVFARNYHRGCALVILVALSLAVLDGS